MAAEADAIERERPPVAPWETGWRYRPTVKVSVKCDHCEVRKHQISTQSHAFRVVTEAIDRHILDDHPEVPRRHRVAKTHGALYSAPRTLKRRRRCDGHLSDPHWIDVGGKVIWSSLPPDHPEICNDRWMHAKFCMNCAPVEAIVDALLRPGTTP